MKIKPLLKQNYSSVAAKICGCSGDLSLPPVDFIKANIIALNVAVLNGNILSCSNNLLTFGPILARSGILWHVYRDTETNLYFISD